MPFRAKFDCLWCGVHHDVRGDTDLEGWAALCPACIGRADDNGFLRARLRAALAERSAAANPPSAAQVAVPATAAETAVGEAWDDWYLRRGDFAAGPIVDQPWQMELDEATAWLDALPIAGTIIELGAGAGWWSTLLAGKGELWMFESDEAALDQARQRLVAHGLLAHLHVRDPLAPPEQRADVVFAAYLLGSAADERAMRERLRVVRGWLRPGGRFAFIDAVAPDGLDQAPISGPQGPIYPRTADILRDELMTAGFESAGLARTHSAFVMGHASVPE